MEARVGIEPTHKGFAVFRPSPKPLKIPANSVECSTRIGRFFRGFSPYWVPFGDPQFMPSQPTVWRFTSLLNVINHPRSIWRRLGGSSQREYRASRRRFGQIPSGDVFLRLVDERLKDLLPSLAARTLDRQAADACLFPRFFDHGKTDGQDKDFTEGRLAL